MSPAHNRIRPTQRRRVAPAPSSRYNEAMKRLLLASLSLCAPFALALSVPWDSLDWTQAQTVSSGKEIALNGATEWVLRVALPTTQEVHTGYLQIRTASEEMLGRGAFRWVPSWPEATLSVGKTPDSSFTNSAKFNIAESPWKDASIEWRKTADYLKIFLVSADGKSVVERGSWWISGESAGYTHLSLEVSDPDAFDSVQFVVITPGPSDPNAPEPGAFSLIVLGGGILLALRRPSCRRITA